MQWHLLLVLLGAHAAWHKPMLQHCVKLWLKGTETPPYMCLALSRPQSAVRRPVLSDRGGIVVLNCLTHVDLSITPSAWALPGRQQWFPGSAQELVVGTGLTQQRKMIASVACLGPSKPSQPHTQTKCTHSLLLLS